jgi:predicted ATPase
MDWALHTHNDETAAGIAASLSEFWNIHGLFREGRDWLRRVLADERQLSPTLRARALVAAATLTLMQGDTDEATAACRLAAQLSRASGDGAVLAHALQYVGYIALSTGRLDEARRLLNEAQHTAA